MPRPLPTNPAAIRTPRRQPPDRSLPDPQMRARQGAASTTVRAAEPRLDPAPFDNPHTSAMHGARGRVKHSKRGPIRGQAGQHHSPRRRRRDGRSRACEVLDFGLAKPMAHLAADSTGGLSLPGTEDGRITRDAGLHAPGAGALVAVVRLAARNRALGLLEVASKLGGLFATTNSGVTPLAGERLEATAGPPDSRVR